MFAWTKPENKTVSEQKQNTKTKWRRNKEKTIWKGFHFVLWEIVYILAIFELLIYPSLFIVYEISSFWSSSGNMFIVVGIKSFPVGNRFPFKMYGTFSRRTEDVNTRPTDISKVVLLIHFKALMNMSERTFRPFVVKPANDMICVIWNWIQRCEAIHSGYIYSSMKICVILLPVVNILDTRLCYPCGNPRKLRSALDDSMCRWFYVEDWNMAAC